MAIITIVSINVSFAPVNIVIETVITKPLAVPILGGKMVHGSLIEKLGS